MARRRLGSERHRTGAPVHPAAPWPLQVGHRPRSGQRRRARPKGRFVQDLAARDFEVLDGGVARTIKDFRRDLAGVSVACCSTSAAAWKPEWRTRARAATHVLSWLTGRATRRPFSRSTRGSTSRALHGRAKQLPGLACSRRSARLRCTTPSPRRPSAWAAARAPPRGGRVHRRQRHIEPADSQPRSPALPARSTCRSTSSASCRRSTTRRRTMSTPSAVKSPLAGSLSDLADWTGGQTFMASTPGERSVVGAADRRRASASVSHCL